MTVKKGVRYKPNDERRRKLKQNSSTSGGRHSDPADVQRDYERRKHGVGHSITRLHGQAPLCFKIGLSRQASARA